jgi:hypothetical protein
VVAEDPGDGLWTMSWPSSAVFDDLVAEVIDGVAVVTVPPMSVSAPRPPSSVSLPARPLEAVVAGVAAQAVGEVVAGQRGGAW